MIVENKKKTYIENQPDMWNICKMQKKKNLKDKCTQEKRYVNLPIVYGIYMYNTKIYTIHVHVYN